MTWHPISFTEIEDEIESSFQRMNADQRLLWDRIRVTPVKWKEVNHGGPGDGFWVVGIFRNWVIWYNDIEEGFNVSEFREPGTITEYFAQQDSLEKALNRLNMLYKS